MQYLLNRYKEISDDRQKANHYISTFMMRQREMAFHFPRFEERNQSLREGLSKFWNRVCPMSVRYKFNEEPIYPPLPFEFVYVEPV